MAEELPRALSSVPEANSRDSVAVSQAVPPISGTSASKPRSASDVTSTPQQRRRKMSLTQQASNLLSIDIHPNCIQLQIPKKMKLDI